MGLEVNDMEAPIMGAGRPVWAASDPNAGMYSIYNSV